MPKNSSVGLASQRRGQIGVNVVEGIVLREWRSRWQQVDAQNDDGVDGLIFLESDGAMTGQVIYVQVKCQEADPSPPHPCEIWLRKASLNRIRSVWGGLAGAVILVHVHSKSQSSHWVDLRPFVRGSGARVQVPVNQNLSQAKQKIASLCGSLHLDINALPVATNASHFKYLGGSEHIQPAARRLYKDLANSEIWTKDKKVQVVFDRTGWRHITRGRRPRLSQYQSFALLGAVRPIIEEATTSNLLELQFPPARALRTNIAIKAAVEFPHRQSGLVQVILTKRTLASGDQYRFLTVYEPRRKRSLMGGPSAASPNKP